VGALGGVLVALSLKYADSVTKTIATTGAFRPHPRRGLHLHLKAAPQSTLGLALQLYCLAVSRAYAGAIVLSTLLNAAFLDGPCNLSIVVGTLIVVVSVVSYSDNGS